MFAEPIVSAVMMHHTAAVRIDVNALIVRPNFARLESGVSSLLRTGDLQRRPPVDPLTAPVLLLAVIGHRRDASLIIFRSCKRMQCSE